MSETQAGWYPDPENPSQQRWWDGQAWGETQASTPAVAPAPGFGAPAQPGYGGQPAWGGQPVSSGGGTGMIIWAVINFFLCWPMAIAALIFAIQGNSSGDPAKLKTAKTLNLIATIAGAIIVVFYIIIAVVAASHTTCVNGVCTTN